MPLMPIKPGDRGKAAAEKWKKNIYMRRHDRKNEWVWSISGNPRLTVTRNGSVQFK